MKQVIVRAYAGEPLRRVVWDEDDRAIYIASPELSDMVKSGESRPVGFPPLDVFAFDALLFERLNAQWGTTGKTEPALWREAQPYRTTKSVEVGVFAT